MIVWQKDEFECVTSNWNALQQFQSDYGKKKKKLVGFYYMHASDVKSS